MSIAAKVAATFRWGIRIIPRWLWKIAAVYVLACGALLCWDPLTDAVVCFLAAHSWIFYAVCAGILILTAMHLVDMYHTLCGPPFGGGDDVIEFLRHNNPEFDRAIRFYRETDWSQAQGFVLHQESLLADA